MIDPQTLDEPLSIPRHVPKNSAADNTIFVTYYTKYLNNHSIPPVGIAHHRSKAHTSEVKTRNRCESLRKKGINVQAYEGLEECKELTNIVYTTLPIRQYPLILLRTHTTKNTMLLTIIKKQDSLKPFKEPGNCSL